MSKDFIYQHIINQKYGVLSTISPDHKPESAFVGIAITKDFEIIFDTVKTSRKYHNLVANKNVSFVIGWENETTVQYEGKAQELSGPEGEYYKEIYFEAWPDGRDRLKWPGIVHFVIKPSWIRYSNFNKPQVIEEMGGLETLSNCELVRLASDQNHQLQSH